MSWFLLCVSAFVIFLSPHIASQRNDIMKERKLGILAAGNSASKMEKMMEQVLISAVKDQSDQIDYVMAYGGEELSKNIEAFNKMYNSGGRVFIIIPRTALSHISNYAKVFAKDAVFISPHISNTESQNIVQLQPSLSDMAAVLLRKLKSTVWNETFLLVDSCPLCHEYHTVLRKEADNMNFHLNEPVYCNTSFTSDNLVDILHTLNQTLSKKPGIPLLLITESTHKILVTSHKFTGTHNRQWFSPFAIFDEDSIFNNMVALDIARQVSLYTAVYADDTANERRILQSLAHTKSFSLRNSPSLLYWARVYQAIEYAHDLILQQKRTQYINHGKWYGAFVRPSIKSNHFIHLLQNSEWLLDNYVIKVDNNFSIIPSTSTVILPEDLTTLKEKAANMNCTDEPVVVQTYDPFSCAPVRSQFVFSKNFTHVLIIPNKNGYFMTLRCQDATVEWLCHPSSNNALSCLSAVKTSKRSRRQVKYYYSQKSKPSSYYYDDAHDRDDYYGSYGVSYEKPEESHPPPPSSPMEFKDPVKQKIKGELPNIGSCVGAATGCVVCYHLLTKVDFGIVPGACMGPCIIGTFGNCGGLIGKVKSDITVVCTELFMQDRLDLETYMADAQFGMRLSREIPQALAGYQRLAGPLVWLMQRSDFVSDVVSKIALPWAKHMQYVEGYTDQGTSLGAILMQFGVPLCTAIHNGFQHEVIYALGIMFVSFYCMWILHKRYHIASKSM